MLAKLVKAIAAFSLFVSMICLLRVLKLGWRFDRLQKRQKKALNSQILCIRNEVNGNGRRYYGPRAWKMLKGLFFCF